LKQLEVVASRYEVSFATLKQKSAKHADALASSVEDLCRERGIPFLGSVNANSSEIVERAAETDLVIIGGYDAILKEPILEAPRYGVLNTHLGVLPLNRGCFPTMWAQIHGLPQGYTTYQVGRAIDHGAVLDLYEADASLGGLTQTNRQVYDELARRAVERFAAALDRYERGQTLAPCRGLEAYHRKGLPNDGWLSFHWSNAFLRRFSLALDFSPYMPGSTSVGDSEEKLFLAIEDLDEDALRASIDPSVTLSDCAIGQVLSCKDASITVRTQGGAFGFRCVGGAADSVCVGCVLRSRGNIGSHPIDLLFAGDVLPLDPYQRT